MIDEPEQDGSMFQREVIRRRSLPHWDVPGAAYFVTTCLVDSIPAQGLLSLKTIDKENANLARPNDMSDLEWNRFRWKRRFSRLEQWLDQTPAAKTLSDHRLAKIVADSILYYANDRYDLFAFVVMPSHIHWVFQPLEAGSNSLSTEQQERSPRETIIHSINRYTARQCNKVLNQSGDFWQHESYDHWVRDVDELERIILYIEGNPVKAGLVDSPEQWTFSSAWQRKKYGLEFGVPIPGNRNLPPTGS